MPSPRRRRARASCRPDGMKRGLTIEADPTTVRAAGRGSFVQSVTRFWLTLAVISMIVYATLLVVGRTAGFRDLIRNRLEMIAGMPLSVQACRLSATLKLHVEGVREAKVDEPSLEIHDATMRLRLLAVLRGRDWPFRAIEVRGARLRFTRGPDGNWTPLPQLAGALVPWMQAEGQAVNAVPVVAWMRASGTQFSLKNVALIWREGDDAIPDNAVEGLALDARRVRPFDEDVWWSRLRIQSARAGGEEWLRDLELEWLRLDDEDIVLKVRQGDRAGID
jgi:hypothetical protein